jgi:hypothetical protein
MRRLYPARLLEVRATDTIEVELDLGFNVYTRQKIRLFGVASCGKDAEVRQVLLELCRDGLLVEPIITKRAKLGRVLGWAYLCQESGEPGLNINEALVEQDLAQSFQAPDDTDEDD